MSFCTLMASPFCKFSLDHPSRGCKRSTKNGSIRKVVSDTTVHSIAICTTVIIYGRFISTSWRLFKLCVKVEGFQFSVTDLQFFRSVSTNLV